MTILVISTPVIFAEPSVYSRTVTYKGDNSGSIYALKQQVASLREEVDGLKSIVESLSARAGNSSRTPNSNSSEIELLRKRVEKLEAIVKSKNSNSVKQTPLPAKNNSNSSFNINSVSSNHTNNSVAKSSATEDTSSAKLYKKGVILFDRKRYSEAKNIFEVLLNRRYKPASTNFYLGEIAYRTGKYKDAIKYYQSSAELNENAAYMDRLLLHTGISLENDGNKEQAMKFYQAIIDGYPGTSSARIAKKRLK